jgi:hypothetical protein
VSRDTRVDPPRDQADAPSTIEITVVADPAARTIRDRISRPPRAIALAMLGVVAAVAVTGVVLTGGGGRGGARIGGGPETGLSAQGRPPGIPASTGLPPRCAAVTMLGNDPTYARADFSRAGSCGPYTNVSIAILHRADGVPRPRAQAAASPNTGPGSVRTGARVGAGGG